MFALLRVTSTFIEIVHIQTFDVAFLYSVSALASTMKRQSTFKCLLTS